MDDTFLSESEEWTLLADLGGAFDFWRESAEDVYNTEDGEPV
jgi:hypothetical protein